MCLGNINESLWVSLFSSEKMVVRGWSSLGCCRKSWYKTQQVLTQVLALQKVLDMLFLHGYYLSLSREEAVYQTPHWPVAYLSLGEHTEKAICFSICRDILKFHSAVSFLCPWCGQIRHLWGQRRPRTAHILGKIVVGAFSFSNTTKHQLHEGTFLVTDSSAKESDTIPRYLF